MKKAKKLISLMLTVIMVLAMSITAFAADPTNYNLTIETKANHKYTIYQLAKGNVSASGEKLSNIKVGSSVKAGVTVDQIKDLTKYNDGSADLGDAAWALIDSEKVVKVVVGTGSDVTESLESGYYVVLDEFVNAGEAGDDSVSRIMVDLVKDTTMTPKTISTEPGKEIIDNDASTDTNEASIGDEIEYRLTGTIPNMAGYKGFKFVLIDTMSIGLTPKLEKGDTLKGEVGGAEATFTVTSVSERDENGNIDIRIALNNAFSYRNQEGAKVSVNIKAIINENAPITGGDIPNKVKIDYSNNPNYEYNGDPDFGPDDPKGTTPEKEVKTYTTSLTITKVVGGTNKPLTGAEFKLTGDQVKVGYVTGQEYVADDNGDWYQLADGAYTQTAPSGDNDNRYKNPTQKYKLQDVAAPTFESIGKTEAKAFVDKDGKVVFSGLGAGTYTLSEVTTPDGYNTMADIRFTVTWTKEAGFNVTLAEDVPEGFAISVNKGTIVDKETSAEKEINTTLSTIVPNYTGTELPSTGGVGTTIFYIVGAILVIGAGIILVAKKRMGQEQ